MKKINLSLLYQTLLDKLGPQNWWPADSRVEILLGAILVQNTSWSNVTRSLRKFSQKTDFIPENIRKLSLKEIESLIYSSGFYKGKARTIQSAVDWFDSYNWDYENISNLYGDGLRRELLKIKGIGYETSDVILVYIFERSEFIADAYARRLFSWLCQKEYKTYDSLYKEVQLPEHFTPQDANEFHALIDVFSKKYLKKDIKEIIPLNREDFY